MNLRVEFAYDALGNRIQRSYDADGDGGGSATVEKYAFDPHGNPWADMTSGGSLTTRRLYQDALDSVFARIDSGSDEDWLTGDRLGSIRDILDDTGAIINHIDYESFGAIAYESTLANADRFGFAGFENDRDINLGLNGARWFSFEFGGWISEDPIGFAGGDANVRRYVGNDSQNLIDSSGLEEGHPFSRQAALRGPAPHPAVAPYIQTRSPEHFRRLRAQMDAAYAEMEQELARSQADESHQRALHAARMQVRNTGLPLAPDRLIDEAMREDQAATRNILRWVPGFTVGERLSQGDILGAAIEAVIEYVGYRAGRYVFRALFGIGPRTPPRTGGYRNLATELQGTGRQAHHLNQNAVYRDIIPESEGLSVGLRGNAFTEVGTPHYEAHRSLEGFWNQFRRGGARFRQTPTNAEYGQALEQSLRAAGLSRGDAAGVAAQAAQQRATYGLAPNAPVPRIPGRINQTPPPTP